jgi:hypothetical protein
MASCAVPGSFLFPLPPRLDSLQNTAPTWALFWSVWGRCGGFSPLGWVEEDAKRPQRGRVLPPNVAEESIVD